MGNAYPKVLDINALVGVQVPHCEYPSMILAIFRVKLGSSALPSSPDHRRRGGMIP